MTKKGLGRERFLFFSFWSSDRLFSSKVLCLKYKVVLQLSRLCLLANFPARMRGGGGRGAGTSFFISRSNIPSPHA